MLNNLFKAPCSADPKALRLPGSDKLLPPGHPDRLMNYKTSPAFKPLFADKALYLL